jgi:hypothetical protein
MTTAPIDQDTQRKLAVELFNHVWTLLEKPNRIADEDEQMVHAAHASRHHWQFVGTAKQWSIGEWQISRVYSVLKRAEPAVYHAARALRWAEDPAVGPFYVAYGYEAMARACAVSGDRAGVERNLAAAREIASLISDQKDRRQLENDLATISISDAQ